MSSNNIPTTGTVTANAVGAAVGSSGTLTAGVWLSVESTESNGIEVIGTGQSTGNLMATGDSRFFPCNNLADVTVKRDGGADVTVTYYAF